MGREIERKWIIDKLPFDVEIYPHTDMIQGYLCYSPTVRVRKDGEEYYLTYKSKGHIEREEYNLPLNEEAFNKLIGKCEGRIIEKTRYRIPYVNDSLNPDRIFTIELDIFSGYYKGKIYAEVEFESLEEAYEFTAPDWFGIDVTDIPGYSNSDLARN